MTAGSPEEPGRRRPDPSSRRLTQIRRSNRVLGARLGSFRRRWRARSSSARSGRNPCGAPRHRRPGSDATSSVAAPLDVLRSLHRAIAEWRFAGWELSIPAIDPTASPCAHGRGSWALRLLRRLHEDWLCLAPRCACYRIRFQKLPSSRPCTPRNGSTARAQPRISNRAVVHLRDRPKGLALLTLVQPVLPIDSMARAKSRTCPSSRPGDPHTVRVVMTIHKAIGSRSAGGHPHDCPRQFPPRVDTVLLREEGKIVPGFVKDCQPDWDVPASVKRRACARRPSASATSVHAGEGLVCRSHSPATERNARHREGRAVTGPDTVSLDAVRWLFPREITEAMIGGRERRCPRISPALRRGGRRSSPPPSEMTPYPSPGARTPRGNRPRGRAAGVRGLRLGSLRSPPPRELRDSRPPTGPEIARLAPPFLTKARWRAGGAGRSGPSLFPSQRSCLRRPRLPRGADQLH